MENENSGQQELAKTTSHEIHEQTSSQGRSDAHVNRADNKKIVEIDAYKLDTPNAHKLSRAQALSAKLLNERKTLKKELKEARKQFYLLLSNTKELREENKSLMATLVKVSEAANSKSKQNENIIPASDVKFEKKSLLDSCKATADETKELPLVEQFSDSDYQTVTHWSLTSDAYDVEEHQTKKA